MEAGRVAQVAGRAASCRRRVFQFRSPNLGRARRLETHVVHCNRYVADAHCCRRCCGHNYSCRAPPGLGGGLARAWPRSRRCRCRRVLMEVMRSQKPDQQSGSTSLCHMCAEFIVRKEGFKRLAAAGQSVAEWPLGRRAAGPGPQTEELFDGPETQETLSCWTLFLQS